MATVSVTKTDIALAGERLLACVAHQGSAAHPYVNSDALFKDPMSSRNLADAVHFISVLHGRYPGVLDHAANRSVEGPARNWFNLATPAFAQERAFLAKLVVAVGPAPGTPGSAGNQAIMLQQRNAIDVLAQSERNGCSLGAALALALDWATIRNVLKVAAERFGVNVPSCALPDQSLTLELVDSISSPAMLRAVSFGAEQIMVQHFGLWDLLEARQQARAELNAA